MNLETAPVADEAAALVAAREDHYASMSAQLVPDSDLEWLDERSLATKAQDLYGRPWVFVPIAYVSFSSVSLALVGVMGLWSLVPALFATAFTAFTGLVSERRRDNREAPSVRADVAEARDDFRAALAALTTSDTETSVAMAVKWLEPRMDEAIDVLASDFQYIADVDRATETILSIGARAWALAQVEERRVHVIEAAVAPAVEELSEAVESSPVDFTEIDSITAGVVAETVTLAASMDVELPVLVEPRPVPDDSLVVNGYRRYAQD